MDAINTAPGMHGAAKWGVAGLAGFQQVPDVLLMKQQELGLEGLDLLVLLNVTSFWWRGDEPPYLRTKLIAGRLNVSVRSVQRVLKKLEGKGLIRRDRWTEPGGKTRPAVFLDGLVRRLEELTILDKILSDRMQKPATYVAGSKPIPKGGTTAF
ncbi:MAG TPA: helix-turn-helix domain-containing protein [Methylomirabilota bacterium]|nr:helix-turn-helix domain-containing protein [Methylomirabilota bacterium]